MAGINRIGSPMDVCDESLDEAPGVVEKRKLHLKSKQQQKSPFLIGTIEDVNNKIGKLAHRLQSYTMLVVESRASDYPDGGDFQPPSTYGISEYHEKEEEKRDVCRFAGLYTLKSTLLPNLSYRVRNISKISLHPSKDRAMKNDKDKGKPKFVELHQFAGFDSEDLTPLPGYQATQILEIVANATLNLQKKPQYQPEFQRLFFSPLSQAMLQDTFWYVFLSHFQPDPISQRKLFNRAAHNYVKLILFARNPHFTDTFLKAYPRLLSQAVYVAFCHCFPDSYRQFGEHFKNELVYLVYGWVAGIRPSPRSWLNWNFAKLEPAAVKNKEDILNKKRNMLLLPAASLSVNLDNLDSLVMKDPNQTTSSVSINKSSFKSSSSTTCYQRSKSRHHRGSMSNTSGIQAGHVPVDRNDKAESSTVPSDEKVLLSGVDSRHTMGAPCLKKSGSHRKLTFEVEASDQDQDKHRRQISWDIIATENAFSRTEEINKLTPKQRQRSADVSEQKLIKHQRPKICKNAVDNSLVGEGKNLTPSINVSQDSALLEMLAASSPAKSSAEGSLNTHKSSQDKKGAKQEKDSAESLSPIQEHASDEAKDQKVSRFSGSTIKGRRKMSSEGEMKSHPACRGPDFLKATFNIHGRSPLVAHFLNMCSVTSDTSRLARIQRTEIDNLPPLDAPTYQDVIKYSSKTVKAIEKQYQEMAAKNQKELVAFLNQQSEKLREHRRRESALLSNKAEVKRLSDLIILEQRKGLDSISAGAGQAVEIALMSQDLPASNTRRPTSDCSI